MILGTVHPHNYLMPMACVKSWLKVAGHYSVYSIEGPYIYDNRNKLLQLAKKNNESILMIDADIVFALKDVQTIEDWLKSYPCVTGVYALGNGLPALYDETYKQITVELFQRITASGGGFLGISDRLVNELPNNAFDNILEGTELHGEDISFCKRTNGIWVDPSIKVGHVRTQVLYPVNN